MIKEYTIIEFNDKFYAFDGKYAIGLYNPKDIPLSNGMKVPGILRNIGKGDFVEI
jgi:hypothetical protein